MRFEGKVAIVTGAGGGIGEGYAKALAAEGAHVVVAELNAEEGERVAKEITAAGNTAIAVTTDVSDEDSTKAMAAAAIEAFGGIDLLVNNAAIYKGMRMESMLTVDYAYWQKFMSVNVDGALLCTRAVVESMTSRGGGAIVNQSSSAAWMGAGYYGIAKLAVHGLTHSFAKELGWRNIRVNAIAPGPTDTEATRQMVPEEIKGMILQSMAIQRMGEIDDIVAPCLFLLSDDARFITGVIVNVDGGQILRP